MNERKIDWSTPPNSPPVDDSHPAGGPQAMAMGAGLLLELIAVYHELLHAATEHGTYVRVSDPDLNAAYIWVVDEIRQLLADGQPFREHCPVAFEPALDHLLPSGSQNRDWASEFAPSADSLVSDVQSHCQRYIPAAIDDQSPLAICLAIYADRLKAAKRIGERHRDRTRLAMEQLGHAAQTSAVSSDDSELQLARWFDETTRGYLTSDCLRKQRQAGKHPGARKTPSGYWKYSIREVCDANPQYGPTIRERAKQLGLIRTSPDTSGRVRTNR